MAGTFVFEAMQVGVYSIAIEAQGFKKSVSSGNKLAIGEPTTVNATLQVGATAETVEVSEAAELVQTSTSGNFGSLVEQRVLQDLPIVGTDDVRCLLGRIRGSVYRGEPPDGSPTP